MLFNKKQKHNFILLKIKEKVIKMAKNAYDYYVLKFSKKEYLEKIKIGELYFKESKYFKYIEENNVGDSREGKIRVDPASIPQSNDIMNKIARKTEELNFYQKKDEKTPIFCCSIIDKDIINKIDDTHFDFKSEFIQEMEKWGNDFILINLGELLEKVDSACKLNKIYFYGDKVKYDRMDRILTFHQLYLEFAVNPILAFYHKNENYKWQNEFRITLYTNGKNLISDHTDNYILKIKNLENAVIYHFEDLYNIGLELIPKDKI